MKTIEINPNKMDTNPQLQVGDTFVRKSKYGHVFGVVESFTGSVVHSIEFECIYAYIKIKSTTGVEYDYKECQKVIKKYTPEQVVKLKELNAKLKDSKESFDNLRNNMIIHKEIKNL
jgi:hypothetical protein